MTSRDFVYWLQGFMEIQKPITIEREQVDIIQKHLNLVFYHEIDPSYTEDKKVQEKMQEIHDELVSTNVVSNVDYTKDFHKKPENNSFLGEHKQVYRC